jgi:hypothetical protein
VIKDDEHHRPAPDDQAPATQPVGAQEGQGR